MKADLFFTFTFTMLSYVLVQRPKGIHDRSMVAVSQEQVDAAIQRMSAAPESKEDIGARVEFELALKQMQ